MRCALSDHTSRRSRSESLPGSKLRRACPACYLRRSWIATTSRMSNRETVGVRYSRRRERDAIQCNSKKLCGLDSTRPHLKYSRELILAVELLDSCRAFFARRHFDEAEAARATCFAIFNQGYAFDRARLREQCL